MDDEWWMMDGMKDKGWMDWRIKDGWSFIMCGCMHVHHGDEHAFCIITFHLVHRIRRTEIACRIEIYMMMMMMSHACPCMCIITFHVVHCIRRRSHAELRFTWSRWRAMHYAASHFMWFIAFAGPRSLVELRFTWPRWRAMHYAASHFMWFIAFAGPRSLAELRFTWWWRAMQGMQHPSSSCKSSLVSGCHHFITLFPFIIPIPYFHS